MDRSSFAAELCQHRNNTVAVPGCSCPIPITPPFDTDTDSDPDPDLASPLSFSDKRCQTHSRIEGRKCARFHRYCSGHVPPPPSLGALGVLAVEFSRLHASR
ncbi:MAG: hypothetical protein ACOX52_06205 [Verrucomicrobiota bacterium]